MMTIEPTVMKWLGLNRDSVLVGDKYLWVIPDGVFTPEEIEKLRQYDVEHQRFDEEPIIANFLPDDVRPEGVKKL